MRLSNAVLLPVSEFSAYMPTVGRAGIAYSRIVKRIFVPKVITHRPSYSSSFRQRLVSAHFASHQYTSRTKSVNCFRYSKVFGYDYCNNATLLFNILLQQLFFCNWDVLALSRCEYSWVVVGLLLSYGLDRSRFHSGGSTNGIEDDELDVALNVVFRIWNV